MRFRLESTLLVLAALQLGYGTMTAVSLLTDARALAAPADRHILVGPGFSDVSPHEVIRTSGNVIYAVVPDCAFYPCSGSAYTGPPNALHAYRATGGGVPPGFTEVDSAHHPTGVIGSAAVALGSADVVHTAWITSDNGGSVFYAPFATATDTWGAVTKLATTGWTNLSDIAEGVAIAVDASGTPTIVYDAVDTDGVLHLFVASLADGWRAQRLDDVPIPNNGKVQHPAMAFTASGDLAVAYMTGTFNYTPDGVVYVRVRAQGAWVASVRINDAAMTTIDNGPSLLITPDGVQHLTFLNTNDEIRYWYNAGAGWRGDRQPPMQQTHDPSLGPDGNGGIRIYGHGTPQGGIEGHGDNLYFFHRAASGGWEPWTLYATGSFDCSVSTRWSQFFHYHPESVDIIYWNDAEPYTLYFGTDSSPPLSQASPVPLPSPKPRGPFLGIPAPLPIQPRPTVNSGGKPQPLPSPRS